MELNLPQDHTIHYIALWYALASLAVGLAFGYMGYKLFTNDSKPLLTTKEDSNNNAGDIVVRYEKAEFALRRGAPGSFFCLVAAIIIAVTLYKGIDLTYDITIHNDGTQNKINLPSNPPK
jgi:hypothetical protein